MGTTYVLSGDFADQLGDNLKSLTAYVRTNLPAGSALIDTTATANSVRLGTGKIDVAADGTFSVTLLGTANTGLNVAANTLRYEVVVEYVDPGSRGRKVWSSGFFELTANTDLKDVVVDVEAIAVASASQYAAAAQASADQAAAITGLTGEDAAVALLVGDTGSDTNAALSATIAAAHGLYYANVWDGFFAGKDSAHDTSSPTIWANSTHLTNAGLR